MSTHVNRAQLTSTPPRPCSPFRPFAGHYGLKPRTPCAGLRIGEALTLQITDVDFERHGRWVRRTWGSRKEALGADRINAPKSNKSRRVDMSTQLGTVLHRFVTVRNAEARLKGQALGPWLFPGRDGESMTPEPSGKTCGARSCAHAGVRYRKPHTLRHTYASLLIENGESL